MIEKNYFIGCDISAAHGAIVLLDDHGHLVAWSGFTFKAADGKLPGFTRLIGPGQKDDPNQKEFTRLAAVDGYLRDTIFPWVASLSEGATRGRPLILALEDYAYHGQAGQHSIAQVGGLFRAGIYRAGAGRVLIRMLCPGDIGKMAVDNAHAKKDATGPAIAELFPAECARLPDDSEGDMRDALAVAKIAHAEREVRAGRVTLESLTPGLRRVFIRAAGRQTENLVSRPYVR